MAILQPFLLGSEQVPRGYKAKIMAWDTTLIYIYILKFTLHFVVFLHASSIRKNFLSSL
jgi:hypothetical protein